MTLYELTVPLPCRRPGRWHPHLRYALLASGAELTLPAGTWLLALAGDGADALYRLADGTIVSLARPLTDGEATPIDHPDAVQAMASHRPLEQAALEEWGVQVEHVDRRPPFRLIKCPLCGGTDFASVEVAQVWCEGCHATFTVRHTAGDPGFVVDCGWEQYRGYRAHYLLPRTANLWLTLVLKDSGDLLDLAHNDHCWRDDCTPEQVALTGPDHPLRPGLHACHVGTCYGWSLHGRVPDRPAPGQYNAVPLRWPDGREETWPGPAFVRTGPTSGERAGLTQVAWELEQRMGDAPPAYRDGLLASVRALLARPGTSPSVAHRAPFPDANRLREGERYLLYRWLLQAENHNSLISASPVWLVVAPAGAGRDGWRVVRADVCPRCGEDVLPEEDPAGSGGRHRSCRSLWARTGWVPLATRDS